MPDAGRRRLDLVVLLAILALAALTRLPGLDLRGQWDADQGNEMLVLLHLARNGQVPLVGPSTFAGTFHHGALYYYVLAPAALLSDASPRAVVLEIAVLGIATVAAVWALGRSLAGAWSGHVAGLLAAVSPAGILGSTFIWNPNLAPLGTALALLGAAQAWRASPRWWLLAALGTMLAMQTHVSGGLLVPPLALAFLLDVRRRRADRRVAASRMDGPAARMLIVGLASAALLTVGYVPLLVHELQTGGSDVRGLLGYLGSGGGTTDSLAIRVLIAGLRSAAWPFVGSITDAPMASVAVVLGVVVLTVLALRLATRERRPGLWLLGGTFAWSLPALAVTAPTLATSVPGLPNDHYHTFLDPLVLALTAAGVAMAWERRPIVAGSASLVARGGAALALVLLVGVCVWRWPPPVAEDGGWPLSEAAAARVIDTVGGSRSVTLVSIPSFKSADALRFPLERRGVATSAAGDGAAAPAGAALVIVCDPLFDQVDAAPCGGPAEQGLVASMGGSWQLADAFAAGPRRFVWVFSEGSGS